MDDQKTQRKSVHLLKPMLKNLWVFEHRPCQKLGLYDQAFECVKPQQTQEPYIMHHIDLSSYYLILTS